MYVHGLGARMCVFRCSELSDTVCTHRQLQKVKKLLTPILLKPRLVSRTPGLTGQRVVNYDNAGPRRQRYIWLSTCIYVYVTVAVKHCDYWATRVPLAPTHPDMTHNWNWQRQNQETYNNTRKETHSSATRWAICGRCLQIPRNSGRPFTCRFASVLLEIAWPIWPTMAHRCGSKKRSITSTRLNTLLIPLTWNIR